MKTIFKSTFVLLCAMQLNAQQLMNPAFRPGGDIQGRSDLGLCCTTQASLGNNPAVMNVFSDFKSAMGKPDFTKANGYAKIKGSAYFDKEFKKGVIYSSGEEVAQFYVRYDAFNDDLEIKRNKYGIQTESLIRSEGLSCRVEGQLYEYKKFVDAEGNRKSGYLMVVHEGEDYNVYVKNKKVYKEGKAAKTSFATTFPPRFLDETEYYVSSMNTMPRNLKLKRKEVLTFFDGLEKQKINNFIKNQNIRFETKTDLVKVFRYADDKFDEGVALRN